MEIAKERRGAPTEGSGLLAENRARIKKIQYCRCWLSILRAAGRSRLQYRHQVLLREIDALMEQRIHLEKGLHTHPKKEPFPFFCSMDTVDGLLAFIQHCLGELHSGYGLSFSSRMLLSRLEKITEL